MQDGNAPSQLRRAILVFVKYPSPGRVKTRLAAALGAERAAEIYKELVNAVFRNIPASETVIAAFDPPDRKADIAEWLSELRAERLQLVPQTAGDLGERLSAAFTHSFQSGFHRLAVIGTDCVEITPAIFTEMWKALEDKDVVLGPADDGGYYLLALKAPAPGLFEEIAWSTSEVLAQTLARATAGGLSTHLLPQLSDVDTEGDWLCAQARLQS